MTMVCFFMALVDLPRLLLVWGSLGVETTIEPSSIFCHSAFLNWSADVAFTMFAGSKFQYRRVRGKKLFLY